jgi:hypothetical protein
MVRGFNRKKIVEFNLQAANAVGSEETGIEYPAETVACALSRQPARLSARLELASGQFISKSMATLPTHVAYLPSRRQKIARLGFDTPAAMPGVGPLRRWKRFMPAFDHIDAAIEAAHPSISRNEFRHVRGGIVEMLCDAEDDDERAEQVCLGLDAVMSESLVTLMQVPVSLGALASGDLIETVAALGQHESARIRSLARDVVRGWRSDVESELDCAKAAMEALNSLPPLMLPEEEKVACLVVDANAPVVATGKDETRTKDTPPAKFSSNRTPVAGTSCGETDKILASKRKLREGYQEAENAKRRRRVCSIDDPKMLAQKKEKIMHPAAPRERSGTRCGNRITVRRSLMPSFRD